MRYNLFFVAVCSGLLLLGCEEEPFSGGNGSSGSKNQESWSIPSDEVFDGGPGKDGIPALDEPEFINAGEADYLSDGDLVLGFVVGDEARAYPHHILDWHEIVNDHLAGVNISVTYCPLTGTGIGWNREIDGKVTTFGVSGLLYNSNLIPYDRSTNSNWSQIRLDCVNGSLKGREVETFALVETSWLTWKKMYPATRVVSTNTGYNRSYGRYPYGGYRTENDYLIFPVSHTDDRLPGKERVLGVLFPGATRIYTFEEFSDGVKVINDKPQGRNVVVVGSKDDNFMVSFLNDPGDGTILSFSPVEDAYPIVMTDEEGNKWDVFGRAVDGPRTGAQLGTLSSFMGYWFSFATFYPDLSIYGES
jgi:hypothetical protein